MPMAVRTENRIVSEKIMNDFHRVRVFPVLLSLITSALAAHAAAPSNAARRDFPVPDGPVFTMLATNGTLYMGGSFSQFGVRSGAGVSLDSADLSPRDGQPYVDGAINVVVPDASGGYYIGGEFQSVGGASRPRLAHIRADGTVDLAFNPAPSGSVHTLALSGSTIYVGGSFSRINNTRLRNNIAAVDAATGAASLTWDPNASGEVYALAVSGSRIYVGGSFTNVGGAARNNLAAIDAVEGGALAAFDPSPGGPVRALILGSTRLYLGGSFTNLASTPRSNLAAVALFTGEVEAWDPSCDGTVFTLTQVENTIYAGGEFGMAGGAPRQNAVEIDATSGQVAAWNPAPDGRVNVVAATAGRVILGGAFRNVNGVPRVRFAVVSGGSGAPLPVELTPGGDVRTAAVSDSTVYVGGAFSLYHSIERKALAAFDLQTGQVTDWNPRIEGADGTGGATVYTLAYDENVLFAGGIFTAAAGAAHTNIVALDPATGDAASWNPQASTDVLTIAVTPTLVYIGGLFTNVSSVARSFLAAIDRDTSEVMPWNPNPNGAVNTLTAEGNILYVGGVFTTLSGQPRRRIGSMDTLTGNLTTWAPEATGPVGTVITQIRSVGDTVYVGGTFTSIGGQFRTNLAALNRASGAAHDWNPAINNRVWTIVPDGSDIYVGGDFTVIGGVARGGLASIRADTGLPTGWNPAANLRGLAVVLAGDQLYAGGRFTTMGTGTLLQNIPYLASFRPSGYSLLAGSLSSASAFRLNAGVNAGETYRIESSTNLIDWLPVRTNTSTSSSIVFTTLISTNNPEQFFRTTSVLP